MDFTIDKTEPEETIAEKLFFTAVATEGMPTAQRVFRSGLKKVTPKELYDRFAVHKIAEAQNSTLKKMMIDALKRKPGTELHPNMKVSEGLSEYEHMKRNNWNNMVLSQQGNQQQHMPIIIKHPPYCEPITNEFSIEHHFQQHEPEYIAEKNKMIERYTHPNANYRMSRQEAEKFHLENNPTLCIRKAKAYGVIGKVVFHHLDQFMDTIPDRVMQSYLSACELGFKEFLVAEPVIEKAHHRIGIEIENQVIGMVIQKPADPVLIGVLNDVMFEIDYWE